MLNNEFDFSISLMLKIYLQQDCHAQQNKKDENHLTHATEFSEACLETIYVFNQLIKGVFPKPPSDFKLREEIFKLQGEMNKESNKNGWMLGGLGAMGQFMGSAAQKIGQQTAKRINTKNSEELGSISIPDKRLSLSKHDIVSAELKQGNSI
jgi:hypothetical protein